MATDNDTTRTVFETGLRNAHALEHEALALMDRQIDRAVHYPEVQDRLRMHRVETQEQIHRLETVMSELNVDPSGLKDLAMSLSGNLAALAHTVAGDEILKNSFANLAFENFEVASYVSLITVAEAGPFSTAIPALQATLAEERSMAAWAHDSLPDITRKYLSLRAAGEDASH